MVPLLPWRLSNLKGQFLSILSHGASCYSGRCKLAWPLHHQNRSASPRRVATGPGTRLQPERGASFRARRLLRRCSLHGWLIWQIRSMKSANCMQHFKGWKDMDTGVKIKKKSPQRQCAFAESGSAQACRHVSQHGRTIHGPHAQ